jgi:hypothetical protein
MAGLGVGTAAGIVAGAIGSDIKKGGVGPLSVDRTRGAILTKL